MKIITGALLIPIFVALMLSVGCTGVPPESEPDIGAEKLSFGMTYDDALKWIEDNDIDCFKGNALEDTDGSDIALSITVDSQEKVLKFTENAEGAPALYETLRFVTDGAQEAGAYIFAEGVDEELTDELPRYSRSEAGCDTLEFELADGTGYCSLFFENNDSGFFVQSTYADARMATDERGNNAVCRFSREGELPCGGESIGADAALELAKEKYGEINSDGLAQSYFVEGYAMYKQRLYYSIRWGRLADERSSYNGNIYVSLDGNEILTGDRYYIWEAHL